MKGYWIAHTPRMPDGFVEKKALTWIPKGARRRDFPIQNGGDGSNGREEKTGLTFRVWQ